MQHMILAKNESGAIFLLLFPLPLSVLAGALKSLDFPDPMPLDELFNLPDEDIINEILNEDQILSAVIDLFKDRSGESVSDMDEEDDIEEQKIISTGEAA